jgi:hypothetical protein
MALKKSAKNREPGPKGNERKAGPRKFYSDQPIRSQGQRDKVKKQHRKQPWSPEEL